MARDLNKVMLIGYLGKDPESRYFPDGSPLTMLSLATSNTYKDKQGQRQQKTQWHSVKVYGKMAEFAQQFLNKGSKLYVEGELVYRDWYIGNGRINRPVKSVMPLTLSWINSMVLSSF